MNYEPTIGLEIHAELKTLTKMFCDSPNNPDEKHANVNVCPICLGHPGTLPVINKTAVEAVIKVGLALGGTVNKIAKFDRKNYFYPDLPKGYQISQYDQPLVIGGRLKDIRLRRIHLEEDTGRLLHPAPNASSLVDFNRAGVPLMELVTEPDIKSAEEAVNFAKELQLILRYLGVSDADMEKGHLRIEANVSLNAGTKVELKNINSFRAVGDAIKIELERQEKVLKKGEKVKHETRGWDDVKKTTTSQRSKEEARDYRYFPEPDLPPFETESFDLAALKIAVPELPKEKRVRFQKEFGLDPERVEILVADMDMSDFFEQAVSELQAIYPESDRRIDPLGKIKMLYSYLTSDLQGLVKEGDTTFKESKVNPEHLAHLIALIEQGKVLSRGAKDILRKMFETGSDPENILDAENLGAISNKKDLEKIVKEVIMKQEKAVADYKKGKEASIKFLVGQAMSRLKGRGNPDMLKELFRKYLS